MTEELARAVDPDGQVIGVDPSPDMRAGAEARCSKHTNTRILDGTATSIPIEDEALDAGIALRVFEHVSDIEDATAALFGLSAPA